MADAKVAFDSYEAAIKDVKAAMAQMSRLEARSKKTVDKLSRNFEKAKQVADKLAGFNTTHLVNGRFVSCPVSKPYSFIDSWGAARSGGRAHKGTDIMNPMGNKVHAIVDGVISRQSTSSLGGISLYMRGVDGNEYYYAHLSRYASVTGQRAATTGQKAAAKTTSGHREVASQRRRVSSSASLGGKRGSIARADVPASSQRRSPGAGCDGSTAASFGVLRDLGRAPLHPMVLGQR